MLEVFRTDINLREYFLNHPNSPIYKLLALMMPNFSDKLSFQNCFRKLTSNRFTILGIANITISNQFFFKYFNLIHFKYTYISILFFENPELINHSLQSSRANSLSDRITNSTSLKL